MDHIKLLKDISAELIRQENGHHEVNNIVTNAVRKHGLDLDALPEADDGSGAAHRKQNGV